jgi:hypothetical protein
MRLNRLLKPDRDLFNAARRIVWQRVDQVFSVCCKRLQPPLAIGGFEAPVRFSLITVNFSTTDYLKLMLLTLCEQENLASLRNVVIVDNHSKDGGEDFLTKLASQNKNIHLVRNKFNCTHARGIRKGIAYVDELEGGSTKETQSNVLLVCDTDIIFRSPQTLNDIGELVAEGNTAFAGELRHGLYEYPEAQASFFAVRRDCYAKRGIWPIVHHGAPAYFMQRSFWKTGLKLLHFPSNHGGYILHRGRTAVSATKKYHPLNAFATAENDQPHFMGVPDGEAIWGDVEKRYENLLLRQNQQELLEYFNGRF